MLTNTNSSVTDDEVSRSDVIEKILYHGHRLRNAMVRSILDHDPFNTEIFNDLNTSSFVTSRLRKRIPSQHSSLDNKLLDVEKRKIKSFLTGDSMNPQDQVEALETLRSMSSEDICKTTNEAYKCACSTCLKYDKHDLNCDLKRLQQTLSSKDPEQTGQAKISYNQRDTEVSKYLKYVDCLQISIHDLILNEKGNKKVNSYLMTDKKNLPWGSQTFFVEYELPFVLSVSTAGKKIKKSVTNINKNNFVRICARRLSNEAVHFKHTSVHNIRNVDQINLEGIKLKFQITCRTMKQKNATPIGYVQFNFANFESSPTLTCIEELPINFDDTVPIVLGKLRVTLQMGYGRLYFGNEFIACFEENQKHPPLPTTNNDRTLNSGEVLNNSNIKNKESTEKEKVAPKFTPQARIDGSVELGLKKQTQAVSESKTILFGLVYVPEAQYTKPDINSFITCRPFCQEEKCYSQLVRNERNPSFDFYQLVPLVYDEDLIQKFRDNFMVIEFWEKFETEDILFGVTKLQLNQFYLAYRNADITRYLLKNKLPVLSCDRWEAIINPFTDELVGQAQVLFALGTEEQIRNLQLDRGFEKNSVKANYQTPFEKNKGLLSKQSITEKARTSINKKEIQTGTTATVNFRSSSKSIITTNKGKSTKDQGVQSDFEMDAGIPFKERAAENEKLEQILNHLKAMRNQQHEGVHDKETNTDNGHELKSSESVNTLDSSNAQKGHPTIPGEITFNTSNSSPQYQNMSPLVRSTSDLLNTLQAALSVPPPVRQSVQSDQRITQQIDVDRTHKKCPSSFKVHIAINQAMHLPVRKKCKAKKNKGRSLKMEDNAKPSSYVTFETMPGLDLKITHLVQKSTNPEWNYKCDAILPADLLTNNKQRLIFKVWRKSTNTNMVPNLQTDLIIGFAAVDLTVLLSGLPNIKGWYNIIDLSSKCNGQINVHITPLEDLAVFRKHKDFSLSCTPTVVNTESTKNSSPTEISILPPERPDDHGCEDEGDGELLSRALKRKFAELDEITQRLRLRLSHVTNEETEDDADEIAEQFERDINTLSIEDDFDMVNFEHEVSNNAPQISDLLKIECSSESSNEHSSVRNALSIVTADGNVDRDVEESLSILDRQLLIGKHRIDTLLGKLSLISGDMNNSRYISGCSGTNCEESADVDTEAILKDLSRNSRPNIHASTSYDRAMFQQIYEYPDNEEESNISSNTSVISRLEESRPAPDGEGTLSEDRNKLKNMSM